MYESKLDEVPADTLNVVIAPLQTVSVARVNAIDGGAVTVTVTVDLVPSQPLNVKPALYVVLAEITAVVYV